MDEPLCYTNFEHKPDRLKKSDDFQVKNFEVLSRY